MLTPARPTGATKSRVEPGTDERMNRTMIAMRLILSSVPGSTGGRFTAAPVWLCAFSEPLSLCD